jgi:hypothetical protein
LVQSTSAFEIQVDEAQIKRTIIGMTITAPNSIRAIEPIFRALIRNPQEYKTL